MKKTPNKDKSISLEIHGVKVRIISDELNLILAIRHDFSFFESKNTKGKVDLEIFYQAVTPSVPSNETPLKYLTTPRNVTYRLKNSVFVDYFGKASMVYPSVSGPFYITTKDLDLAREIVFLTVLSRVSEVLDRKGLHRVHALGLEYKGNGILLLLPSGGGKTTMALNILTSKTNQDIRLISEDSPLIDRRGYIHSFPLRIGVLPQSRPKSIPQKYIRNLKRMEFSDKETIDVSYFKNNISTTKVPLKMILLGERSFTADSSIVKVTSFHAIRAFLINSVIGIGLYQGLEFLSQIGLKDAAVKGKEVLSRGLNSMVAISKAPVYRFNLGSDKSLNLKTFTEHLEVVLRGK